MDRIHLITLSDRAASGVYEDLSTPVLREWLQAQGGVSVTSELMPDDAGTLEAALRLAVAEDADLVLTCGGTGFGPRDLTPEATRRVLEREAPGIAEFIRARGGHPMAFVSRAVCGTAGRTVILNLSGRPAGALEQLQLAWPLLRHAVSTLRKRPEPSSSCT
ncbi:MAG TPA: MogA/MoaB family molybdenum cofactor biosynthesis protein [Holophagaceae bacterium]|nr:MogA/MoaB family molybdenum cofactor biosynthesis protein [Holophagaceae bacterium]